MDAVPHTVLIIAMIAIAMAAINHLATVATNAIGPSKRLRRSLLVSLATSMVTRPSTPMRSAATTLKIASQAAAAMTTTTTTGSAATMRTTMMRATVVATTSLLANITRQSEATAKQN